MANLVNFSYEIRLGMTIANQVVKMVSDSIIGEGGKIQYGHLISVSESNRNEVNVVNGEEQWLEIDTTLKYHFEIGMVITLKMRGVDDWNYGMQWKAISGKVRFFHEDLKNRSEEKSEIQFPERVLWDKKFAEMFFKHQAKKLGILEIKNRQRKGFVRELLADKNLMCEALQTAKQDGFVVIKYGSGPSYGVISTMEEALKSLPYYETAKLTTERTVCFYKMTLQEIGVNLEAADAAIKNPNATYWGTVRQFGELINAGVDGQGTPVGNNGVLLYKDQGEKYPYLYARVFYGHDGSYGRGIAATELK